MELTNKSLYEGISLKIPIRWIARNISTVVVYNIIVLKSLFHNSGTYKDTSSAVVSRAWVQLITDIISLLFAAGITPYGVTCVP